MALFLRLVETRSFGARARARETLSSFHSVPRGFASNAADDSILSGEREVSNWYAESCSFLAVLLLCLLRIGKRSIESERLWNVRDFRLLAGGETCVEK